MRELFKENRIKALKRDDFKCRKCGLDQLARDLDVHHVIPFKKSKDDSLRNLITLCSSCHRQAENQFNRVGVTNYLRRWMDENSRKMPELQKQKG
jgi:5-methylcytosine-specific restriction endonuclease McrA